MGGGDGETVQRASYGINGPSSPSKLPAQIQQLPGADTASKPASPTLGQVFLQQQEKK